MWVNVSQLLKASIGSIRNYEVNEVIDVSGSGSNIVQGEVRLMHTHRGILANGTLHTEVEVTCSRCLSLCSCPVTLNIEEECFSTVDAGSGTSLSLPDEPDCFIIDEHHVLDLTEAIRQYVLMAIPAKPLCREECAGLCPDCGHNLNQGPCGCVPQETEPRWAKLRDCLSDSPR